MNHVESLNEAQRRAVLHTEGPLLVLAGAGAGKTRVLSHRIIHLIEKGIAPHHILAVTFTNKAAKEMRERVVEMIGTQGTAAGAYAVRRAWEDSLPMVTTFHSLGVHMLREHHHTLGLRRHFTICDRSDSTRAVKEALRKAGYDPKQFEPRRILGIISRAKGDALSRLEFADRAEGYLERVVSETWEHYENILQHDQALDFDDLLLKTLRLLRHNPTILAAYRDRFRYIHIDEYQDTNKVQYEIVRALALEHKNICVVGDIDQCLAKGTQITMADGGTRPIECLRKGDEILSNYGSGVFKPARVTKTFAKKYNGTLIRITTKKGRTVTSTPEHMHFAGFHLGTTPQLYFTYLMYKRGVGWRIGTSQTNTKGQRVSVVGFIQRSNQEHADATWVLATHATPGSARVLEYTLSLQYSIPTLPFVARKGQSENGYVHDQKTINRIFSTFDTDASAKKLLGAYGLSFKHPHHSPRSRNGSRNRIVLTLCGERRGCSPLHRISMVGNDRERKKILGHLGLSMRPAKAGSRSWRFETAHKDWGAIKEIAERITKAIPECEVVEVARLGKVNDGRGTKNACSLPFLPASSVREGMALCDAKGMWDVVEKIERMPNSHTVVYDLNIERSHNFIANGIITHNSIYSWRGADIANILQFEKHFPGTTTLMLEENYRSTGTIIEASNDIIKINTNRPEKTVFTKNDTGEKISLYMARSGADEAEFIALRAKELIGDSAAPSDIAVLFRTNFQSRALEEAFLNFGVPYQVVGARFFERKEVKDVLSFLRLTLTPENTGDLARVINVPPRGIGKVTLLKLMEGGRAPLEALLLTGRGELRGAVREKVETFDTLLNDLREAVAHRPISETVKYIISRTGLEAHLKKEGDEGLERLENLHELVTLAVRYDDLPPEDGALRLIEDAALQSDQDELKTKEEEDAVRLMTVHAAKGLEFSYVFVAGLEEGLFPHERLSDEHTDEEEERRLFYVALTRAKKKVFLSFAHVRTIFGTQRMCTPSHFITDIREELIELVRLGDFISDEEETAINLDE